MSKKYQNGKPEICRPSSLDISSALVSSSSLGLSSTVVPSSPPLSSISCSPLALSSGRWGLVPSSISPPSFGLSSGLLSSVVGRDVGCWYVDLVGDDLCPFDPNDDIDGLSSVCVLSSVGGLSSVSLSSTLTSLSLLHLRFFVM